MLAALVSGSVPVFADAVYVVDVQKVINDSIIGKAARNNVEGMVKKSEAKLGKIKADLTKLQADAGKQGSLLSASAMEEKQKQISRKERELQDEVKAQRDELSRAQTAEIEKVVVEVRKAVSDISESRNLGVVVEKDPRVVLYASDRIDISAEVVKMLDAKKTQL